ncbi:MAG: hypothetical protein AAFX46_04675 [Cyanobacteria bacterium J06636_27]
MNIKAIALASVVGLSAPAITAVTLNPQSASATPRNATRPTGAFLDKSKNWVIRLNYDRYGNYIYDSLDRKNYRTLNLKNPAIAGTYRRYTYTFYNGRHKYIVAHRPNDPQFIRVTVINPQGRTIFNRLMKRVGDDWDV